MGSRATLEAVRRALVDERSGRVVFVSHCLLNENVRYLGGAARPAAMDEIVDACREIRAGICQMPCPEQAAWGGVLKRRLLPVYGAAGTLRHRLRRPLTRLFLAWTAFVHRRLARAVADEIADYRRSGFEVVGVVGVGASPSCGVTSTLDVGRVVEGLAACPLARIDRGTVNAVVTGSVVAGAGSFIGRVRAETARRGVDVPFLEHDLVAELEGRGPSPAAAAILAAGRSASPGTLGR